MPTSDAQKRATAKWREANKKTYNSLQTKYNSKWRKTHPDDYKALAVVYTTRSRDKWYVFQSEAKRLRNILFDGFIPIN